MRAEGFDGRIVLMGEEPSPPYQRPPLSKEFLRGEVDEDFAYLRAPEFYSANAIETHWGDAVRSIDPHARRVDCASGSRFEYDKALVATGGIPRRLRVEGSDLPGVYYLRTLEQARHVRKALERRPRVLVVGGGFIGCEVAASARLIGCDVTIAGPSPPMAHALGSQVGEIYAQYHAGHGVNVKVGVTVVGFRGAESLEEATLSDGSTVPCDVAVVGIGIVPNTGMFEHFDGSDGIATDEFCRAPIDDVYAAGDVARSWRPRLNRCVRLEHFDNAQLQGAAAGRSMCGSPAPYDPIPFFWSDQYDLGLQYYGNAKDWDRVVVRGRPAEGSFIAFYLQDGRIEAACGVNRSRDSSAMKRLLGRTDVPPARLADDGVLLSTLLGSRTEARR